MRHLFASIVLLLCCTSLQAKTISLICPEPSPQSITITKQPYDDSWRAYQYQAVIPVDLPVQGNQLLMMGQGSQSQVNSMQSATWTDQTFLCWYRGPSDSFVLYTVIDFDPYVDRCYFKNAKKDECLLTDPKQCELICELKNND